MADITTATTPSASGVVRPSVSPGGSTAFAVDDTPLDPSYLRYGSRVMLRSGVADAGHMRVKAETGVVAVGSGGVGRDGELFVLQNSAYRADRGPVLFSDEVCLRSVVTGRYLGEEAATGMLKARRELIGKAEKWVITPSVAPANESDYSGGMEQVLAGLVGPSRGAVRACIPLCLRSYTRRFLSVESSPRPAPAPYGGSPPSFLPRHALVVTPMPASSDHIRTGPTAEHHAPAGMTWHLVLAHTPFSPAWNLDRPLLTGQAHLKPNPERGQSSAGTALQPLGSYSSPVQEELLVQDLLDSFLGIDGRYIGSYVRDRTSTATTTTTGTAGAAGVEAIPPSAASDVSSMATTVTAPTPTSAHHTGAATSSSASVLGAQTVEDVEFRLDPAGRGNPAPVPDDAAMDGPLAFLAQRMLPVGRHYVRCAWFVERRSRPESGLTAQALAAAARAYLEEHHQLVLQLEDRSRNTSHRLSLMDMWYLVQPALRTLSLLDTILSSCLHAVGGRLLTALHHYRYDPECRSMALFLLEAASGPMLTWLEKWIFQGVVDDRHGEFFVASRADLAKENMNQDYNAVYWDERYTVRGPQVPVFLEPHADTILTTGKYLNAVRLCDISIDCPFTTSVLFAENDRDYGPIIQRAYRFASAKLLDHLMGSVQLMQRLTCLKNYFLLQQGDFLVHFMDVAQEELCKTVDPDALADMGRGGVSGGGGGGSGTGSTNLLRSSYSRGAASGGGVTSGAGGVGDDDDGTGGGATPGISLQRLSSLLELSLRSSIAASDPFIDDLTCALERSALIDHLDAIHNLASGVGDSQLRPTLSHHTSGPLTGYHVFALDYSVRWPLSIVLSRRALTKYQLLFRHMFFCKHVERELCSAWMAQRRAYPAKAAPKLSAAHALRHRMLHFLQNLYYYMAFEVIQPKWIGMMSDLRAAVTVDEVLRIHNDFLDSCLKDCLLTNHSFVKLLTKLMMLCILFAQQVHAMAKEGTSEEADAGGPGSVIDRSDKFFRGLLHDFLTKLTADTAEWAHTASLVARLDYNGFYRASSGVVV